VKGGQAVQRKHVQVDVLAAVARPAIVADLGKVSAMVLVPHLVFEEAETFASRCESTVFLDPMPGERAEEPELARLHGQKFLAGCNEPPIPQPFEIAAMNPIDACP
jgi:hypothetical protein